MMPHKTEFPYTPRAAGTNSLRNFIVSCDIIAINYGMQYLLFDSP